MKQFELFEENNTEVSRERKPRVEDGYRDSNSKDGGISITIPAPLADRVKEYCKRHNSNKTRFIASCVEEQLNILELQELQELYASYSKEELIALIMKMRGETK